MNENERDRGMHGLPGSGAAGGPRSERGAEHSAQHLSDVAQRKAREIGEDVRDAAAEQADRAKESAVSHLDAFAEALRAASDELSKNQSGPAAEMVTNAASGLEGLTRSLHGKSTGDMIETVREFGRANPIGFLAGSVLAGVALGRFASVATTDRARTDARPTPSGATAGEANVNKEAGR